MLRDFMSLTLPMRAKNLASPEGLGRSIRQHEMMVDLLRTTDGWALAQLTVDHMQHSKDECTRSGPGDP